MSFSKLSSQCVNVQVPYTRPFFPYCQLVDMAVPLLRAEHDVLGEAVAMHGLVWELGFG